MNCSKIISVILHYIEGKKKVKICFGMSEKLEAWNSIKANK